ncbi:MAG: sugar phosphate isomerase/epimerase [Candidatus Hydrogenedentes bacterium]|nr:sugar phosphate isomerase/epimerase [Candidatus Hydrogenedentota bacterium]
MGNNNVYKSLAWTLGFLLASLGVAAAEPNPFFAMCTGTRDAAHESPASQVALVKELGYAGTDILGVGGLKELLAQIDAQESRFFALYTRGNIDVGAQSWEEGLEEAMALLKGRDCVLWMPLVSKTFGLSSPAGDDAAVALLRRLADLAAANGLKIALYPHANNWMERVEDCVRVAKKVDRANVGVTFNLCHWLKVDGENMEERLVEARPHLFMVTVNGADGDGESWKELIQPLGDGSYDVGGLLKILSDLNYEGPIGLQGYGIGGDVAENLRRSMNTWRTLTAK